jgi:hypothetical protein
LSFAAHEIKRKSPINPDEHAKAHLRNGSLSLSLPFMASSNKIMTNFPRPMLTHG